MNARSPLGGGNSAAVSASTTSSGAAMTSQAAQVNPWGAASMKPVPVTSSGGSVPSSPGYWPQNGASPRGQPGRIIAGNPPTTSVPQTGVPPHSIPITTSAPMNGGQQPQPRKRARP